MNRLEPHLNLGLEGWSYHAEAMGLGKHLVNLSNWTGVSRFIVVQPIPPSNYTASSTSVEGDAIAETQFDWGWPSLKFEIKRVYEEDKPFGWEAHTCRQALCARGAFPNRKHRSSIWLKDIAPSIELRKWFGHDPDKWAEFQTRYRRELGCSISRCCL